MPETRKSGRRPSQEDLDRGGFNPRPAETSKPKEQVGPLPTDAPGAAKSDGDQLRRDHVDGNPAEGPDPLEAGHIEGQNPNTPERLPGHTRFARTDTPLASNASEGAGNVVLITVALAALAALIVMLASAG